MTGLNNIKKGVELAFTKTRLEIHPVTITTPYNITPDAIVGYSNVKLNSSMYLEGVLNCFGKLYLSSTAKLRIGKNGNVRFISL